MGDIKAESGKPKLEAPKIDGSNFKQYLPNFDGKRIEFYHGPFYDYQIKVFCPSRLESDIERFQVGLGDFRLVGNISKMKGSSINSHNVPRSLAEILDYATFSGANLAVMGRKKLDNHYFLFNVGDEKVLGHIMPYTIDEIKTNITAPDEMAK